MDNNIFSGVCTALVTPFLGEKVNYPMMQQLLKRQIDAGIRAVVIAGTTGESATLTDAEKIELFVQSKAYTGSKCSIIAGTGSNSTSHAVELSLAAEEAGADALLVVSPYYNKATADGLFAHYVSIAHAVQIPVILYNVPSRTGVDIPVSVYRRLSRVPNIIGVKEASTDITKIIRIRRECPNSFHIWSGNDDMTVPIISLGGTGVISVMSNVLPEETIAMTNAALAGDFDTAADLQVKLQPVTDLLFCEVNPIPVKYAMNCIGYDCGDCRLPLCRLTKDNQAKMDRFWA